MEQIAIIADDLTGASDTGIQFCKYGLKTMVIVDYQNIEYGDKEKEVWSINADTRPLTVEEAYKRIYDITQKLKDIGFNRIYKKIDSTLRGHPGAELEAMMDALKADLALVVPAFPANGRLMINGHLVLCSPPGKDMGKGESKTELLEQSSCHVPTLLQGEMRRRVGSIGLESARKGEEELAKSIIAVRNEGKQVLVLDAATEEDLASIAGACNLLPGEVVIAGSAGLAAHLPAAWGLKAPVSRIAPQEGVILLVAGSRNPVTAVQIQEVLQVTKAPLVEVAVEAIQSGQLEEEVERVTQKAQGWLQHLEVPVLAIAVGSLFSGEKLSKGEDSSPHGRAIASSLGEIARRLVAGGRVRSLVITGGDTAVHICRAMGARGIDLVTELLPGIPLGRLLGGMAEGLPVVTKAGGFGPPDAFVRVVEYLQDPTWLVRR